MQENHPDHLVRISLVLSVLAGSVGALYVAGGLLLFSRLALQQYGPPLELVTRLPREFLISTALLGIAVPVLLIAIAYLVGRTLFPRGEPPPHMKRWRRLGWSILWGGAVCAVTVFTGVTHQLSGRDSRIVVAAFGLVGLGLASLALQGRNHLINRCRVRGHRRRDDGWSPFGDRWSAISMATSAAVLFGLFAIPFGLMWQISVPLRAAKVCTEHDQVVGTLIGEAADRTYLGEGSADQRFAQLLSISNDEILRVFISRQDLPTARKSLQSVDCIMDPPQRRSRRPPPEPTR